MPRGKHGKAGMPRTFQMIEVTKIHTVTTPEEKVADYPFCRYHPFPWVDWPSKAKPGVHPLIRYCSKGMDGEKPLFH